MISIINIAITAIECSSSPVLIDRTVDYQGNSFLGDGEVECSLSLMPTAYWENADGEVLGGADLDLMFQLDDHPVAAVGKQGRSLMVWFRPSCWYSFSFSFSFPAAEVRRTQTKNRKQSFASSRDDPFLFLFLFLFRRLCFWSAALGRVSQFRPFLFLFLFVFYVLRALSCALACLALRLIRGIPASSPALDP